MIMQLAGEHVERSITCSQHSDKQLLIMLWLCFNVRCTMAIVRSRLSVISVNSLKLRLKNTLSKNVPSLMLV